MRSFVLTLALIGVTAPVLAQVAPTPQQSRPTTPASTRALSLEEAIRLAVANNPRLAAATRDIGAARSGLRSARSLTNPDVNFTPGITSISGSADEFIARQPLELNGTRKARAGVASAQLRGTQAEAITTLRDIVFSTKAAYYDLARAQQQVAVSRELLTLAEESDRIARRQVEEGGRAGVDLAQTGIEVARVRRQVTLAEGEVASALAAFNTLLGREPVEPVGVLPMLASVVTLPQPSTTRPGTQTQDRASLTTSALSARAEIQAQQSEQERLRQEAALARAEGRPDLTPQFRVGYITRGLPPASSGNGVGVGLAVSLPLFDYGSRRNRIRQAEQAAAAQSARITAVQNDIRQEVAQALAQLQAAEAVVRDYQAGVLERAKRLLEASRLGFQEGRTAVVALLEAQRSYIAVQTEYVDALADVAQARAALERATGAVSSNLLPATP